MLQLSRVFLLAMCVGCLSEGEGPKPPPTPTPPTEGFESVADDAMTRLRSNYGDVSDQMADAIKSGQITKSSDEFDALKEANNRARADAFQGVNKERDELLSVDWDADKAEQMFRELGKGYRE